VSFHLFPVIVLTPSGVGSSCSFFLVSLSGFPGHTALFVWCSRHPPARKLSTRSDPLGLWIVTRGHCLVGNSPSSINDRRTVTASGWFMARTTIVVRPTAVLPTRHGPSYRK
jgi:hypothetical protein